MPPIFFRRTIEDTAGGLGVCDLCGGPDPITMVYPSSAFVISVLLVDGRSLTQDYNSDGWASCDPCIPLIDAQDTQGLVARYQAAHPIPPEVSPDNRQFILNLMVAQFEAFFTHRTGPGIPYSSEVPR